MIEAMYNAITRGIEPELIPACRRYGLDIVVYNPSTYFNTPFLPFTPPYKAQEDSPYISRAQTEFHAISVFIITTPHL